MMEKYFKKPGHLWRRLKKFLRETDLVERGVYSTTTDEDSDGIIPNEDAPTKKFRACRFYKDNGSSVYLIWFEVNGTCYCVNVFSGSIIAIEEIVYAHDYSEVEVVANTERMFSSAVKFIAHFMENIAK